MLIVLEAVRRGVLPLITLRLSGSERDQLRNGNVFVWEESPEDGGLMRWTDGRRWLDDFVSCTFAKADFYADFRSQSKVCADCLLYQEKIEVTAEERKAKAMRR